MLARIYAAGCPPSIVVVGLPDTAVKESKDRVTTAVANSGYYWPRGRTTINLAPADVKKEGPSFDLPIALGMIAAAQEIEDEGFADFSFVGELALNGAVRAVKGVLPVALEARQRGKRAIIVPAPNAREAAMVAGTDVYGVENLRQAFQFVRGEKQLTPERGDWSEFFATHQDYEVDFADVKGRAHVKRAVEVAVAGGHNSTKPARANISGMCASGILRREYEHSTADHHISAKRCGIPQWRDAARSTFYPGEYARGGEGNAEKCEGIRGLRIGGSDYGR